MGWFSKKEPIAERLARLKGEYAQILQNANMLKSMSIFDKDELVRLAGEIAALTIKIAATPEAEKKGSE